MNNLLFSTLLATAVLVPGSAQAQSDDEVLAPTPSRTAQYVLEGDRTDPADFVRDILVLIDLGEAGFAQPLFDELAQLDLSDEQRAALVEKVGTAALAKLARTPELGEARTAFVSGCMQAAGRHMAAPERLAQLVEQATADDPGARKLAVDRLHSAGEAAVVACLTSLATEADASKQNRLREALVRLAPLSTPALVAALDAPAPAVRQQAAWALGQVGDRLAVPQLAALASGADFDNDAGKAARWAITQITGARFSATAAAPLLDGALDQALAGVPPRRADAEGMVTLWRWDNASDAPASFPLPREQAAQVHAAQLAAALWRLDQGSQELSLQALVLRLQAESLLSQPPAPASEVDGPNLSELPGAMLSDALRAALDHQLPGAAAALCTELGARRVRDVLYSADGKPTPLAGALDDSHPAVRFAALSAVMQIDPPAPFPGSSKVVDALMHFATSDGSAAAVVAMPKAEEAATLGGYLMNLGIETAVTNVGDEVTCRLIADADVELVLIDLAILRPRVREVLFRLRRDPQTSLVPIALLAPDARLDEAKRIAREHEHVLAIPRLHSLEATRGLVDQLRAQLPVGWPDADQRAEQAQAVAGWVHAILDRGPSFYNLRGRQEELLAAVNRVPDADAAIPSLALLGTPDSQQSLANMASLDVLPIETRRAAAAAFDQSVQRYGLLLTTQQITDQYDRYNASRDDEAQVQQVLGAMLDSIESLRDASLREPGS